MKLSKIALCGAVALAAVSCGKTTRIEGTLAQAPSSDVVVKLLDVNTYKVIDTVTTDASGRYSCKVDVAEGQPEFVYVFYGDTKVASLLLEAGDKVTVESDTLGNYTVTGSPESSELQQVEKSYSDFLSTVAALVESADETNLADVNRQVSREYVDYYRKALAYVLAHKGSLTSVPVLFQNVDAGFPVFKQNTDAITFRIVCDSLKQNYPASKYVQALEKEVARREQLLSLATALDSGNAVNFPDIVLPDITGQKNALSAVDAKVIMVYFWAPSDAAHKMFNVDTLLPLYEQYHPKGFEIYSVAIDNEKATWASAVKNQKLPWINVCDGMGTACPALGVYNVAAVPTAFLIVDGVLTTDRIGDINGLSSYLQKKL